MTTIPAVSLTPRFTTQQVVTTKACALRCRAILEARAITAALGIVFIQNADHIRYNPETGNGEVCFCGDWLPITDLGMAAWAAEEGLDWEGPRPPQRVVIVGPDKGDDGTQDTQPLEPITPNDAAQALELADALAHPLAQEIAHEADRLQRDLAAARKSIETLQAVIRQQSEMLMEAAKDAMAARLRVPAMQFVQVPVAHGQMPADKAALLADGWVIAHEQFVAVGAELHWCARLQRQEQRVVTQPDVPAPVDAISHVVVSSPVAA